MFEELSAPQILDTAAGYIAEGWCKNRYARDGQVCTMGALQQAAFNNAYTFCEELEDGDPRVQAFEQAVIALAAVEKDQFPDGVQKVYPHPDAVRWDDIDVADGFVVYINDTYVQDAQEIIASMQKAAINLRDAHV